MCVGGLQNTSANRPYFAKSFCQLAVTTRREGWPGVARELLEWALANGIADRHLRNELVEAHLAAGNLDQAEKTLEQARKVGLAGAAIYTGVVGALGKARELTRAQQIFDQALAENCVTNFSFTAPIYAYGKAGRIDDAYRVFNLAKQERKRCAGRRRVGLELRPDLLDSVALAGGHYPRGTSAASPIRSADGANAGSPAETCRE